MAASVESRTAASIAERALAAVFGTAAVAALREDSPLAAVGMTPADLVCISDAVASEAHEYGQRCVLDDAAFDDVATVGDLVRVIAAASTSLQEAP